MPIRSSPRIVPPRLPSCPDKSIIHTVPCPKANGRQKPESVPTSVEQPKPGASEKEKQQAVVWLAQDVYKGRFLADAQGRLSNQLTVVAKFRDLALTLQGREGMRRIQGMLAAELGERALSVLPQ